MVSFLSAIGCSPCATASSQRAMGSFLSTIGCLPCITAPFRCATASSQCAMECFLSAAGCSLCTIEYLLMLVAKLQLNSDIPTNSDKIFIVFPVFYSYPSLPAVLTSARFMTIPAKIMMPSTKIMMPSIKIMMAFVRIMTTSTNNITTNASLLSLSATPQALFAPKEHLPTPVLVKGVMAEVLIFSAETLVI